MHLQALIAITSSKPVEGKPARHMASRVAPARARTIAPFKPCAAERREELLFPIPRLQAVVPPARMFKSRLPFNSAPGAGSLADKYGGKGVLAVGVTAWSICTLFTPEAAALGVPALVGMRVAMGLGEGVAFPAIHSLIGV